MWGGDLFREWSRERGWANILQQRHTLVASYLHTLPGSNATPLPPTIPAPQTILPPLVCRSYPDSKYPTKRERSRLFKWLAADTSCCYAVDYCQLCV